MKGFYNCEYEVTKDEVESMSKPAHNFLTAITELIDNYKG